jgi:cytochrome b
MQEAVEATEVQVWDPFVRATHWLVASGVLFNWFTDEPLWLHSWIGYTVAGLVIVRVLWGFVGPQFARFVSFVRGPRAVIDDLAGLLRLSSRRHIGHTPAGGAMIVTLFVMVAATAGTGMANLAADRGQGPLSGTVAKVERPPRVPGERRPPLPIKEVHEILANVTIALVVLHVLGVILASFSHRENLVRAMITGRKRAD